MRISDWSSDVCSSDLIGGTNAARLHVLKPACNRLVQYPAQQLVAQIAVRLHLDEVLDDREHRLGRINEMAPLDLRPQPNGHVAANGRASCRERGCQYG